MSPRSGTKWLRTGWSLRCEKVNMPEIGEDEDAAT